MSVEALSSSTPSATADTAGSSAAARTHTVERGESLSTIARDYQVSLRAMQDANPQVLNPDVVYPDQELKLPADAVAREPALVSAQGPTPTLERDARGVQVAEVQRGLREGGYDPGPADGVFGPRTEAAVRAYQADRGLEVDGIVGRQTWGELGRVESTRPQVPVSGDVPGTGDAISDQRIAALHPEVRAAAAQFVNRAAQELGIQLRVTQGMRTYAEQDALYAQGRTAPGEVVTNARGGQSYHNFGVAFDVVEVRPDGSVNWDTDWAALGALGESMGLEWGGNWTSIVDRPHFQLDTGLSTSELRARVASGDTGAGGFVNLH